MATILVTGGAGFVGAALVEALAARGDRVIAFDIARTPAIERICAAHRNVAFVPGEITEWPHVANVIRDHRPAAVIHCAALVGVLNGAASPLATLRVNVEGTLSLMAAMRLFEVRRLINLSSEEVYGPFRAPVIDESHPCFPVKTYGISKFTAEQLARDVAAESGMEIVHIRTCWVYGPGLPRPRVPKNLIDAAVDGRPLHLPGGADYRVDQIYIDDLVQGILKALDHPRHAFDAYHVTTGEAPPLRDVVAHIREIIPEADISIGEGPYLVGNEPAVIKGALDCSRAREAFGYKPRFSLRDGIHACIAARRASRNGS
jgi:nucleoside-diphosphate-sugar epimerase